MGERSGGTIGGPEAKKERTSWTRAEDDVIVQGVAELGHKWYEIARRLPGRTDHAIRNRWSRLQSIIGLHESLEGDSKPSTRVDTSNDRHLTSLASPSAPPSNPPFHDAGTALTGFGQCEAASSVLCE